MAENTETPELPEMLPTEAELRERLTAEQFQSHPACGH